MGLIVMSWPPPSWSLPKWRAASHVPPPANRIHGHPRPPMFMPKPVSALRTESPQVASHGFAPSVGIPYGSIHSLEEDSIGHEAEGNKEEMFPLGRKSEFQKDLESSPGSAFIGLEYVIEIQHNTSKRMSPAYACLLCDAIIKTKEGSASTLDLIKSHVRSSAHKLSYLEKFFPTLKAKKIDVVKPVDHILVNGIIEKIIQHLGSMQVKLVVGHKLFRKKAPEIKLMVDKSSHHSENPIVLKLLFPLDTFDTYPPRDLVKDAIPKPVPCKRPNSPDKKPESVSREKNESKSKLDDYADIFEEFERAQREQQGGVSEPSEMTDPKRSRKLSSDDELQIIKDTSRRQSSSPKRSRRNSSRSRSPKRRSGGREESSKRSRSPRRTSRERRSRDRKPRRSVSPSNSPAKPINPRTGKPFSSEFFDTKHQQIKEFHQALKEVTLKHGLEKDHFIEHASVHPDYTRRWNRFYRDKQREHQSITIHMDYIKDEWVLEWRRFVVSEYERLVKEDRNRLMNKFRLFHSDLKEYEDFQQLGDAQSDQKEKSFKIPPITDVNQVGPIDAQEIGTRAKSTISSHPDFANRFTSEKSSTMIEVSVISTLRLLSALESLLDYLGPEINVSLGKANNLEVNAGYGSSASMINDKSFFTLINSAREKLESKMAKNAINQQQLKVSSICIDNIRALTEQSICKKPDIVEKPTRPDNPTPSTSSELVLDSKYDALKEAITNTVIEEYRKLGREISGPQLTSIVEIQYERIRGQIRNSSPAPMPAPIPTQTDLPDPSPSVGPSKPFSPPNPQPLFQGYASEPINLKPKLLQVNWNALQSALLTATSLPPEPAVQVSEQPNGTPHEMEPTEDDTDFDDLTLEDLTSLFKNFNDLDEENQKNLLEYMKRIEKSNPSKVTELKRHIHGNGA
eukprot:TCALIF_12663-PA protein Name:"Protein of unknown function" AED:0.36 eAED:0.36 QI:0/0.66/0.42/1/1/1/7/0/908